MHTRKALREEIVLCTESQQRMFELLYGQFVPDPENTTVEVIVDFLPDDRLQWALTQVRNTLIKNLTDF